MGSIAGGGVVQVALEDGCLELLPGGDRYDHRARDEGALPRRLAHVESGVLRLEQVLFITRRKRESAIIAVNWALCKVK